MKQTPRILTLVLSAMTLAACSQQTIKTPSKHASNTTASVSRTMGTNGGSFGNGAGAGSSTDVMSRGTGGSAQTGALDADAQAAINELMGEKNYTPADLKNPNSILAQRIVYFDYDQSTILEKYKPVLKAHAELMANYPEIRVRLEGHADERGSREYNVALSERRAQTVRQYLSFNSVNSAQMETVAFGEEKPLVASHNTSAWNKNRRVELNYTTY